MMRCKVCKQGEFAPGETSVVLQRDEAVIIVRGVPAEVCDSCDEYYLSAEVAREVFRLGDDAVARGAEVEIIRYAA